MADFGLPRTLLQGGEKPEVIGTPRNALAASAREGWIDDFRLSQRAEPSPLWLRTFCERPI